MGARSRARNHTLCSRLGAAATGENERNDTWFRLYSNLHWLPSPQSAVGEGLVASRKHTTSMYACRKQCLASSFPWKPDANILWLNNMTGLNRHPCTCKLNYTCTLYVLIWNNKQTLHTGYQMKYLNEYCRYFNFSLKIFVIGSIFLDLYLIIVWCMSVCGSMHMSYRQSQVSWPSSRSQTLVLLQEHHILTSSKAQSADASLQPEVSLCTQESKIPFYLPKPKLQA